jgi:hypothetical protein
VRQLTALKTKPKLNQNQPMLDFEAKEQMPSGFAQISATGAGVETAFKSRVRITISLIIRRGLQAQCLQGNCLKVFVEKASLRWYAHHTV